MAAVTSIAIGAVSAGYAIYNGEKQRKAGEKELNEFDRQDLENAYEDLPISTYGSDLIREQSGISAASSVDAAQQSGIRGVLSAIPKIQAQSNRDAQQAAGLIDSQVIRRNQLIAGDNANIRNIQERRDIAELAGIGQQIEVGRQQTASGVRGLTNTALEATNEIDWNKDSVKDGYEDLPQNNSGTNPYGYGGSNYNKRTLDSIFSLDTSLPGMNLPDYASELKLLEPKLYEF